MPRINILKPDEQRQFDAPPVFNSPMSWAHVNLLGEYDFSDEKLKDTFGIKHPKLPA